MNALEAASLVMIPSGYEDGTLGSLKPLDGTGDFTFSRGSNISATRVNADGNIEKGYENLLLQSNTFSDAVWTKSSTSVTSSQTGYDGSSDAWLLSKSGANGRIQFNLSTGGVSVLSVYAKANISNYIVIQFQSTFAYFDLTTGLAQNETSGIISATSTDEGNGWYRCSIVFNISASSTCYIYPAENGSVSATSGSIYIQDAMLNQGLVAYPYIETTTAPVAGGILEDMPRLDWSGSCPSLLLEPSRTNLLGYSEYFEAWHTDRNVSYTANSTISPEGLINATKLTATNTIDAYVRDNRSSSAGNNVFSVFAKYEDCQYISLSTRFFIGGDEARVWFDIQNGVKGSSTEDEVTYDIEDYGNGWYRCYVIFNIDAGDTNGYSFVYLSNADSSINVTSGTSAHLYGGQWEVGSYPTSYIPTYGVSQTRLADVCSKDNISGLINSPDGVFYNEVFLESTPLTGNRHLIVRGDASNYVNVYFDTIGSIVARIKVAGVDTFLATPITQVQNKVAILWQANKYALFVNGVKAAENLSGATFPAGTLNKIDFDNVNSNTPFYGEVKQTLLFPTALSDEACIELTTI